MALMMDLCLKVSLLMLVTGAAIASMRRASAASKHVVLTAVLAAAVVLPIAKWTLPALPMFVLAADVQPANAPSSMAVVDTASTPGPFPPTPLEPASAVDRQVTDAPVSETRTTSGLTWSWPGALGLLWMIGATAILLALAVAALRIRKLAGDARPVDDNRMIERLVHAKRHFGIRRPIALVVSPHEWMPITWGLMRPTIMLPASAAAWLDTHPTRLDAVLVHEMAHIARWDAGAQRLARVAVALFWFNPLVWLAARRARLERERACDDAVLAHGLRATDYASDLVSLAQTLVLPSRTAGTALAMARRSQLEQRIGALLDGRVSRRRASGISQLLAAALVLLMLPVAAAQLAARPLPAPNAQATIGRVVIPAIERLEAQPIAGAAAHRPSRANSPIDSTPAASEAPPAVQTPQQYTPLLSQDAKWRLERDAMFRLLLERARTLVKNARLKVQIGTARPVEVKTLEEALAAVETAATKAANNGCTTPDPFAKPGGGTCVGGVWKAGATASFVAVGMPTDAEIASVKTRFTDAIRNLDAAEVRWDNGLISDHDIDAAVGAALKVLTDRLNPAEAVFNTVNFPGSTAADRNSAQALYALLTGRVSSVSGANQGPEHAPVPIRFVTRSGTNPLSDAALLDALKMVASIKNDGGRADTLLDLAARHAFTPEMVTFYVAAAKGITSEAERARVFAQPIRVK